MMITNKIKRYTSSVVVLAALFICFNFASAFAQEKLQKSPGGYHGELDFPISWKRYYAYKEWTKIMHDLQKQYSHLADIGSIGKSRMGKDMYLLTITAKSTGKHSEKTAMWVDGGIHGNEVNGITCSLYLAWYLLTRYDYDEYVHNLVNDTTFYILPGLNVDANESFVAHPNTANNPRETYRPEDNDGDGLYDEDQTEDVDGDGEISMMFAEDPEGTFKLSVDKRRFIRVDDGDERVKRFRLLGMEGFDNDGDGWINEDDIGGPDPNRNYPAGWNLEQGNPYPMSERCTRNAYEAMRTRPNIFAALNFHNAGRLIMFAAPPKAPEQDQEKAPSFTMPWAMPIPTFEEQLKAARKTNKYAQMFDVTIKPEFQHDMDVLTEILTMGTRILKNYSPVPAGWYSTRNGGTFGSSYVMLGAYGFLIELWGDPYFDADENDDGRVTDEEYLKWTDIELAGEGWIDPHEYDHPDLGTVWIGGTRKKHAGRTPPSRYIEMETLKNAQFVMYNASQFPRVEFDAAAVTPVSNDLYWIDVTVKNDRVYPTASDMAIQRDYIREDILTFASSKNIALVEIPERATRIDPADNFHVTKAVGEETTEFRLKGKESKVFRYLVKISGDKGWVEFKVDSFMGGEDTKRINFEIGG